MEDKVVGDASLKAELPVLDGLEGRLMLMCDVCGEPAIGSACSSTGPISFAYCAKCIKENREPYGALVASAMGMESLDQLAGWYQPIILSNLKAEGKTLEEFFADVKKVREEWEEAQKEKRNDICDGCSERGKWGLFFDG